MPESIGYLRALRQAMREHADHTCHIFRLLPWTFPRAAGEEGSEGDPSRVVEVETTDLLRSCPTWQCDRLGSFPLGQRMRELRQTWSHRKVLVAAPVPPQTGSEFADQYCRCGTLRVWRVVGPPEFLREIGNIGEGPAEFPEALPWRWRPEQRPRSLYLCQHEVLGD